MQVSNSRIRVLAMKKAEQGENEYVVRMVEMDGTGAQDVKVSFAAPVVAAREVNGAEEPVGAAAVTDGALVTSFTRFQPRTFAVKFGPPNVNAAPVMSQAVPLDCNLAAATPDAKPGAGYFDSQGRSLPAEILPREIEYAGTRFRLNPSGYNQFNALIPRGETIDLPEGKFTRLYLLAASAAGDQRASFKLGEKSVDLVIQDWSGYIGQWDNRIWKTTETVIPPRGGQPPASAAQRPRVRVDPYGEMVGLAPGFIKPGSVAWFASHRHASDGTNEPYAYSYLYGYAIDMPAGTRTLTLPYNDRIRILAITVTDQGEQVLPVQPLTDRLDR